MRPRVHVPLTATDAPAVSAWSRRSMAGCVLVAAALVAYSTLFQRAEVKDAAIEASSCALWHQAASAVVSRLAQSTLDSDLRQINDAIFRMRRGRKNCEGGWFSLACEDYYAVVRNLPDYDGSSNESLFACKRPATQLGRKTGSPQLQYP